MKLKEDVKELVDNYYKENKEEIENLRKETENKFYKQEMNKYNRELGKIK